MMFDQKIQVGHYYEITLQNDSRMICAVLYGFERGKNKDVYTLRVFEGKRDFEFPVEESTLQGWIRQGRVKELSAEEALALILQPFC